MKKIKGLLLFGILFILGIGFSFGYNYIHNYVDYQNNASISPFYLQNGTFASPVYSFQTFSIVSPFFKTLNTELSNYFDINNFSLDTDFGANVLGNSSFFYNFNGNRLAAIPGVNNHYNYGGYLVPLTSSFGGLTSSDILSGTENGVYIRVFSNDLNCFQTNTMFDSSKFCDPDFVQIFTENTYVITSQGSYADSNINGVDYLKGAVSPSIGKGYSFMLTDGNQWIEDNNGNYIIDGDFYMKSVFYHGSSIQSINGILIMRLNNNQYVSYNNTSNYDVLVISLDPNYISNPFGFDSFNFIYSIYSCPYNSTNIWQCSFVDGGTTDSWFNVGFPTWIDPRGQPSYILSKNFGGAKLYNEYDSANNTITFYRDNGAGTTNTNGIVSFPVVLTSDGTDIISGIPEPDLPDIGGNGNQYTGSGTISLSGCVDTELCTYSTGSDGHTLKLCHTSCVSQDVIDSGGYISYDGTYYFVNTPLSLDDLKNSDLTFSTGYLDSGGMLDPIYFEDLFDPTKKAVGVCPFPYYSGPLDFLSNIGFDGVYFFMPLICFYSAFQHGAHLSYFDNSNIITGGVLSSPLLGGDSENHRIFFMFLDILLSIGLLGLFHHLSSLL